MSYQWFAGPLIDLKLVGLIHGKPTFGRGVLDVTAWWFREHPMVSQQIAYLPETSNDSGGPHFDSNEGSSPWQNQTIFRYLVGTFIIHGASYWKSEGVSCI